MVLIILRGVGIFDLYLDLKLFIKLPKMAILSSFSQFDAY